MGEKGGGKGRGRRKGISTQMRRQSEIHAIDSLCRRSIRIFSRSIAEAKKRPEKMVKPVSGSFTSLESRLEPAVELFH